MNARGARCRCGACARWPGARVPSRGVASPPRCRAQTAARCDRPGGVQHKHECPRRSLHHHPLLPLPRLARARVLRSERQRVVSHNGTLAERATRRRLSKESVCVRRGGAPARSRSPRQAAGEAGSMHPPASSTCRRERRFAILVSRFEYLEVSRREFPESPTRFCRQDRGVFSRKPTGHARRLEFYRSSYNEPRRSSRPHCCTIFNSWNSSKYLGRCLARDGRVSGLALREQPQLATAQRPVQVVLETAYVR